MNDLKSYSQAGQDLFVLRTLNYKRNGLFLELGAWHPSDINNTFLLEKEFDWDGISVDLLIEHQGLWQSSRNCLFLVHDALTLNYSNILNNLLERHNRTEKRLDYLSLDLDPPNITLECLKLLPLNEYRFNVITYEHDDYRDYSKTIKSDSRKYLLDLGYKLVVADVKCSGAIFEDWYEDSTI